jgi:hypothetical protein
MNAKAQRSFTNIMYVFKTQEDQRSSANDTLVFLPRMHEFIFYM